MKTIRLTGIALSIVALLLVAMAAPASAQCSKLNGTYAFRLNPAKGFDADLANNGDPGAVVAANREDVLRVGVFTANGACNITGHTLATTDTNNGDTWLIGFTWSGTYSVNSDLTGTITISTVNNAGVPPPACPAAGPALASCCTGETAGDPTCAGPPAFAGNEENPETYSISISTSNGRVELAETDNTGGGAKIFMVGEAVKQ